MSKQKYRVVAFGGGTGLSKLLEGLKAFYPTPISEINAIVATSDDGGSTGILREEFHMPAPGDVRRCIAALSERKDLLRKLFDYRFDNIESGLHRHAFGNLMLTALREITGSFSKAVQAACSLLDTVGNVIPISDEDVTLVAKFDNGMVIKGELLIYQYGKLKRGKIKKIWLEPKNIKVNPQAISAIKNADIIFIGPGSLYTSVIASMLPKEIISALKEADGIVVYTCNLFNDYGETPGYTVTDYVNAIEEHIGAPIIDVVVVNTGKIPDRIVKRYKELEGAVPVKPEEEPLKKAGKLVITGDFIEIDEKERVRHDTYKLVKEVLNWISKRGRRDSNPQPLA